jgi:hypothetical protein
MRKFTDEELGELLKAALLDEERKKTLSPGEAEQIADRVIKALKHADKSSQTHVGRALERRPKKDRTPD